MKLEVRSWKTWITYGKLSDDVCQFPDSLGNLKTETIKEIIARFRLNIIESIKLKK
jgi:hypothetical protein